MITFDLQTYTRSQHNVRHRKRFGHEPGGAWYCRRMDLNLTQRGRALALPTTQGGNLPNDGCYR